MTRINIHDEDATELMRIASRLGTTIAEVVNVLLTMHGSDAIREFKEKEEK